MSATALVLVMQANCRKVQTDSEAILIIASPCIQLTHQFGVLGILKDVLTRDGLETVVAPAGDVHKPSSIQAFGRVSRQWVVGELRALVVLDSNQFVVTSTNLAAELHTWAPVREVSVHRRVQCK